MGFMGAGLPGAVAITTGIFLPAFAITLIGHRYLEAAVRNQRLHAALDGITAAVVGLVAFTTVQLAMTTMRDLPSLLIFAGAALVLYRWQAGVAVPEPECTCGGQPEHHHQTDEGERGLSPPRRFDRTGGRRRGWVERSSSVLVGRHGGDVGPELLLDPFVARLVRHHRRTEPLEWVEVSHDRSPRLRLAMRRHALRAGRGPG